MEVEALSIANLFMICTLPCSSYFLYKKYTCDNPFDALNLLGSFLKVDNYCITDVLHAMFSRDVDKIMLVSLAKLIPLV